MTHKEFCYWLQGVFEVVQPDKLTKEQVAEIKDKLSRLFETEAKSVPAPRDYWTGDRPSPYQPARIPGIDYDSGVERRSAYQPGRLPGIKCSPGGGTRYC